MKKLFIILAVILCLLCTVPAAAFLSISSDESPAERVSDERGGASLRWSAVAGDGATEALLCPDEDEDYMAIMIAACVSGDAEAGQAAQLLRDEKIAAQGLCYISIDFGELQLLSKIIYAEAGSYWLSDEWKMSVGEVVLNRVGSPEFPDTVAEVIYQPGQFCGVRVCLDIV